MHPIPPYPKPPAGAGHKVRGGWVCKTPTGTLPLSLPADCHCYSTCTVTACVVLQPTGCGVACGVYYTVE